MLSIFKIFKKKKKDDGIVVLKKSEPEACGGTDATLDTNAPKKIASDKMTFFEATSALHGDYIMSDGAKNTFERLGYISAFAAPVGKDTFMFLETSGSSHYGDDRKSSWALVKGNAFPPLVKLVNECDIAKRNGYHSKTHGLPENFGGEVYIRYESGEKIGFSDNQSPILSFEEGKKIHEAFVKAMKGKKAALPSASDICEIRFCEERKNGGYTRAVLSLGADGTGINKKESKYDDPRIYKSEKPVDAETVSSIKESIERCGILAWENLPESSYKSGSEKKLTFVFGDGRKITVTNDKKTPDRLSGGFFDIEIEMATKN